MVKEREQLSVYTCIYRYIYIYFPFDMNVDGGNADVDKGSNADVFVVLMLMLTMVAMLMLRKGWRLRNVIPALASIEDCEEEDDVEEEEWSCHCGNATCQC